MQNEFYLKATSLLEKIANSVHERNPLNPNLFCFSTCEVQLVEKWLQEFAEENKQKTPQVE